MQPQLLDRHRSVAVQIKLAAGTIGGPACAGQEAHHHVVGRRQPDDRMGESVAAQGVRTGLKQPRSMPGALCCRCYDELRDLAVGAWIGIRITRRDRQRESFDPGPVQRDQHAVARIFRPGKG